MDDKCSRCGSDKRNIFANGDKYCYKCHRHPLPPPRPTDTLADRVWGDD